ncbi:hypothetical protein ASTA108788_13075 [Asticcacaulis taihuensis]
MTIEFLYRTTGNVLLFTTLTLMAGMWQVERRRSRPT